MMEREIKKTQREVKGRGGGGGLGTILMGTYSYQTSRDNSADPWDTCASTWDSWT